MYVWHFPIYYSLEYALAKRSVVFPLPTAKAIPFLALLIAASYAAAWISFNCYEQWFLRLKTHFEPVFSRQPLSRAPLRVDLTNGGQPVVEGSQT
jgi:peptidoglycan/LPS O-acetylase OafA/YrhL